MMKARMQGNDLYDSMGTRLGYLSGSDVHDNMGQRLGYFQGDDIFDSMGQRIAYLQGSWVNLKSTALAAANGEKR